MRYFKFQSFGLLSALGSLIGVTFVLYLTRVFKKRASTAIFSTYHIEGGGAAHRLYGVAYNHGDDTEKKG